MNKIGLESCPACGCDKAEFQYKPFAEGLKSVEKFRARCRNCKLRSDWFYSKAAAAVAWNKRENLFHKNA